MTPESRLAQLGIELPRAPRPAANYLTFTRVGDQAWTSGHGPYLPDGSLMTGRLPDEVSLDHGVAAARLTGLNLLATLREQLGSLDRVARVLKVFGMVNSAPGFAGQPEVINGCSDLLVDVFGDAGRHVRSAVGLASLPRHISVEIELVVELHA